jgi:hypothetical protein
MEKSQEYCITVSGFIGDQLSRWLSGFRISTDTGRNCGTVSRLRGSIRDQSELHGIINRIWDLNLTIISVVRLPEGVDYEDGDA